MSDPFTAGLPKYRSPPGLTSSATRGGLTFDPAAVAARTEAETIITRLQEGTKAAADAQKAARIDMARAKLEALKLAAIVAAYSHDPKAARKVAEDAAKVAKDLKALRVEIGGVAPPLPSATTEVEAPAGVDKPQDVEPAPSTAASDSEKQDADVIKTLDGILQLARKVIAIARSAAAPGSPEEREMAALQAATGVADIRTDVVTDADLSVDVRT